jgi:tetratricopeptide (TPR) repeat protein
VPAEGSVRTAGRAPGAGGGEAGEGRRALAQARSALADRHLAQAEVLFNQALATSSGGERAGALLGLAEVALARGSAGEAQRLAKRAAAEGAGARARVVAGQAALKQQQWDEAVESFRQALAVDRGNAEALAGLASAQRGRDGAL